MYSLINFLLALFPTLLFAQQKDPLRDFCRLFGHQTTIVDRKLYIDGGLVNWAPASDSSINYTSTWLRYGDLDVNNDKNFPNEYILNKNDTVPSVQGGILWSDATNKIVYQYGGEYGNAKPEDFRLWFYDIVYKTWNMSTASTTDIRRAAWGAGVAVQEIGKGYYYGGYLTNSSVPGYNTRTPLQNMVVYDMLANSFKNQSGPDTIPRAEGVMLYLPVGDGGFLVYFGGVQYPYGNDTSTGLPMTEIHLYDIRNNQWYVQTATGDQVPENRRRFCAGAAWADDRSSYNMSVTPCDSAIPYTEWTNGVTRYLYGGASVGPGVGFGDVWVLTIPSFRWIKYYPTDADGFGDPFPHHSLTCDVIENSQMIVMGGTFPNHTEHCDVPEVYGQHGLDLGKANPKGAKWAEYNPKVTTYKVPTEIATVIGGAPTGGATILAPSSGWGHRDLSVEFQRAYTPTTRTPTRYIPPTTTGPPTTTTSTVSPPPKKTNKSVVIGAAVGGAVGGLILLTAIGVGLCLCVRRLKKKNTSEKQSQRPPSELPSQSMSHINQPPGSTIQGSPSVSQFACTPHGSPPPPSERAWSQYGRLSPTTQNVPSGFGKDPLGNYPEDANYHGSAQSSPTVPSTYYGHKTHSSVEVAQELPIVRSPLGFQAQQRPQGLNIDTMEPYFAQHPPRGAPANSHRPT